jgi:nitrate reductase gamma subunit
MEDWMLLLLSYLSILVFVAAIAHRGVKIARLPMHLRWELYPVAHEKGRARYGGSYLEEPDWWTKTRTSSFVGELKVMIPEILLLAGVWAHNRKHWFRTFPFHFGLYLLAGLLVLLLAGGIATASGATISGEAGSIPGLLHHLTYIVGYVGIVLGLIGAAALLVRRTFNLDYREYTKKGDYFNLVFFIVTLLTALLAHLMTDPQFIGLRAYFAQLVTLGAYSPGVAPSGLTAAEVVLVSLLLAYIPLTHMSHFFTKWFMYHDIRWSDEPNLPGGKIERKIGETLKYPVSWAAPHIRGDGKKNWADVATSAVEEDSEQ